MKKVFRLCLLTALAALTLCAGALAFENPVTITLEYDHALCNFTVTDRGTGQVYDTDTIVLESGTSAHFEVSNIAEGYRIASGWKNGRDATDMFVDGGYGGFSTKITKDVSYRVEIEPIPDPLPVVAKAVICAEQVPSGASQPVTALNTAEMDGIHVVVYDTAGDLLPLYCAAAKWEYSTDGGATWEMVQGWGTRSDMWFAWSGFEEMGMDYMNMQSYLVRAKVLAKEFYTSTGDADYVISAPVAVNGGEIPEEPEAPETGDGSITITAEPGMLYGNFTGPEGWEYAPYFYNSKDDSVHPGWSTNWSAGHNVQLLFINGTVDRFRLYDLSDGSTDFDTKEPLYDVALDKPITGVRDAFPFPCSNVTYTIEENPNSNGAWNKYRVTFTGLDFENYTYMLDSANGGSYMSSAVAGIGEKGLGKCTLEAYRASETADEYRIETSERYKLTIQLGGETEEPEEPAAMAVSNVRFEDNNGRPYLYWDVPVPETDSVEYQVWLSQNGNDFFPVSSTRQDQLSLSGVEPGVYRHMKIRTKENDEQVAEYVTDQITFTVKEGTAKSAPAAEAAQQEDGSWMLTFSGLTPGQPYYLQLERDKGGSSQAGSVRDNGRVTKSLRADQMQKFLDQNGRYLMTVFSETYVKDDGMSAGVTRHLCGDWASLAALVGGEIPDQPEEPEVGGEYGMKVYLDYPAIIATMTGPADAPAGYDYRYVFVNSATGEKDQFGGMGLNAHQEYTFKPGYYDRYEVRKDSNNEVLGSGKLEKPVTSKWDAFSISGITMSVGERDGQPCVKLNGLDLENYTYTMDAGSSGYFIYDALTYAEPEDVANGATLYAYRNSETADGLLQERSVGLALTMDSAPDVPAEPEEGYGVSLEVRGNRFRVKPVVPEGTDEEQTYDIYLYSSETGNRMGNTGFRLAGGVVSYEEADTYDCYQLLENDTGKVLAEGKLEKSVVTAWDLEVPEDVTVECAEESATEDRYTVTGIDLDRYIYVLSDDGEGGIIRFEASFVVGKDYYGDADTLYLSIQRAEEREDAYYLNKSPYTEVSLKNEGGASGGETPDEPAVGTVTVTVPAGAEVVFDGKTYSDGGTLTIPDVAGGTYDLQVKKPGCLTYTIKGITVGGKDIDLGSIKLLAGDTNGDGMINIVDMGIFRQNFGKTGTGIVNPHTDTNGDGMVNIMDMSTFRTNFGKTAANDCTVKYGA